MGLKKDAGLIYLFWSKGGTTTYDNARLICSSCNASKGAR